VKGVGWVFTPRLPVRNTKTSRPVKKLSVTLSDGAKPSIGTTLTPVKPAKAKKAPAKVPAKVAKVPRKAKKSLKVVEAEKKTVKAVKKSLVKVAKAPPKPKKATKSLEAPVSPRRRSLFDGDVIP